VVRARRSGRHTFKSLELEREIGGMLFEAAENTRVNLHNPDVMVELDVKDDTYYVIEDKITGLSGYPIGFQDKVLSLISGGFDSGVSTQMMMNRGCKVDYLFFNL
jgi:thiamine biosynthesis protein ThiI